MAMTNTPGRLAASCRHLRVLRAAKPAPPRHTPRVATGTCRKVSAWLGGTNRARRVPREAARLQPPRNHGRGQGMPGKFVVKKGLTGKFRFSLLSTNGKIVATS